jgi:hypothetical protein
MEAQSTCQVEWNPLSGGVPWSQRYRTLQYGELLPQGEVFQSQFGQGLHHRDEGAGYAEQALPC